MAIMHDAGRFCEAVNPLHAVVAFAREPWVAFVSLGAVVLAVTGVEALYADMGHFGRGPIRFAWLFVALPALLLNYFGQGAAILADPAAADHAFYAVVPAGLHYPMVALATIATIIASQAVISGIYLHHPPGGAAGHAAAHGNPPYLAHGIRPDLCAARQHADAWSAWSRWCWCSRTRMRWPRPTASR